MYEQCMCAYEHFNIPVMFDEIELHVMFVNYFICKYCANYSMNVLTWLHKMFSSARTHFTIHNFPMNPHNPVLGVHMFVQKWLFDFWLFVLVTILTCFQIQQRGQIVIYFIMFTKMSTTNTKQTKTTIS